MAVKGAVLGDILGSQYEFQRPNNLDWQHVKLIDPAMAGFTDDTVMTLAIKKALDQAERSDLSGMSDQAAAEFLIPCMVEIGRQYPGCGFGGKFRDWIFTEHHEPYQSWGNGSAMRVAYVADFFTSLKDVQDWAAKTARVSTIIRRVLRVQL